jgi:hypothetical protein
MTIKEISLPDNLEKPELELVGLDGNAFSVMGAVSGALKDAGNDKDVIDSYRKQAMAGDYDHLLRVSMAFTERP